MEGPLLNRCGVSVGGEGEVWELNSVVLAAQYRAYIFFATSYIFFATVEKGLKKKDRDFQEGGNEALAQGPSRCQPC